MGGTRGQGGPKGGLEGNALKGEGWRGRGREVLEGCLTLN